jgi:sarcosine oxidase
VHAARLVLAAGWWMPAGAPVLAPLLTVARNAVHWFRPRAGAASRYDGLPVLVIEDRPSHLLYAVPSMRAIAGDDVEDGIKFACHHSGVFATAETVDRTTSSADVLGIQPDVSRYLPDVDPVPVRSSVCCYTNTPDGHFIVDRHPADARVVLVSACSGHGFKFASVFGELIADFAEDVNVHQMLAPFSLGRYSAPRN